jgi:hypothetical protein
MRIGDELRGSFCKPSWSLASFKALRLSAYLAVILARFTSRAFIDSFAIS